VEAAKVAAECVAQFGPFALGAKVNSLLLSCLCLLLFFSSFLLSSRISILARQNTYTYVQ
jgi:hypothetical protein